MNKVVFKRLLIYTVFAALIAACGSSDSDDMEPSDPYTKLRGSWIIDQRIVINDRTDGDGSSLTFNFCDAPPCTGMGYDAASDSEGSFTYEFVENDTQIRIIDEDPRNGGYFNTTWLIEKFDSETLQLKGQEGFWANEIIKLKR